MKHFRWLHYLLFLIQFCWGFYKMKFPYLYFIGFNSAYLKIAAKLPILPLYVGEFTAFTAFSVPHYRVDSMLGEAACSGVTLRFQSLGTE